MLVSRCDGDQIDSVSGMCKRVCVVWYTDVEPKPQRQRSNVSYLSRCDVGVSDVSMNVLNLRQLPLRHLNQLRTPEVTMATERSIPPQ